MTTQIVSDCHGKPVKSKTRLPTLREMREGNISPEQADEFTKAYFECTECEQPCDAIPDFIYEKRQQGKGDYDD